MRTSGRGGSRLFVVVLVMAAVLGVSRTAVAQVASTARPERPNRALFGGGMGETGQEIVFTGNVGLGGYQVLSSDGVPVPRDFVSFGMGGARLRYGLSREHVTMAVSGGSAARYASRISETPFVSNEAQAVLGANLPVSGRTSVSVGATAAYQPLSVLTLFPGMFDGFTGVPMTVADYGFDQPVEHYLSESASASISHGITRRSSLSFGYAFTQSRASSVHSGYLSHGLSAAYTHTMAQGLAMRLGYRRRSAAYGDVDRQRRYHDIDAGIDFSRSLSFSRRTLLSFSTGTTGWSDGSRTRYDVVGTAALTHEIGRTWQAGAGYSRGLRFVDVLAEPVFADSTFAGVSGLIGRRVGVRIGTGASLGNVGVTAATENGYRAYHGTASVQTGLTRYLGVSVEYIYYRYRFDTPTFLPVTTNQRMSRQTVLASFDLFVPLLNRTRSSSAAR